MIHSSLLHEFTKVYPARQIGKLGFGFEQGVIGTGNEHRAILERRSFQLVCGCIVDSKNCLADSCPHCLESLLNSGATDGLVWASTPCKKHYRHCSVPYCEFSGGCHRHTGIGPDGRAYCKEHYILLEEESRLAEVREAHGRVAAALLRFLNSLFPGQGQ